MTIVQLNKYLAVLCFCQTTDWTLSYLLVKARPWVVFMEVFAVNSIVTPEQTTAFGWLNCGRGPPGLGKKAPLTCWAGMCSLNCVELARRWSCSPPRAYEMLLSGSVALAVRRMLAWALGTNAHDCTSVTCLSDTARLLLTRCLLICTTAA